MPRPDGRKYDELRPVRIVRGYTRSAPGSVLIETGETVVLCTASWEEGVPAWRTGLGSGWETAEYDMLPGSTSPRRGRNRGRIDGRTQEIQRLIGRSLRAVVDLDALGENSIVLDCDVLQADGGTRTAAVTGAYVALCDAVRFARKQKWIRRSPVREAVAAVSVGKVRGRVVLDLCYTEDVDAEVDMNVVMTESGGLVEVQGTGEKTTFDRRALDRMVALASRGIRRLIQQQKRALRRRSTAARQ
ncbi:MAG: ribonuclease PH [Planctomycetota bacterium]|nr:MAG: ribonuclease PH [Planctomycetota bacterium]